MWFHLKVRSWSGRDEARVEREALWAVLGQRGGREGEVEAGSGCRWRSMVGDEW